MDVGSGEDGVNRVPYNDFRGTNFYRCNLVFDLTVLFGGAFEAVSKT